MYLNQMNKIITQKTTRLWVKWQLKYRVPIGKEGGRNPMPGENSFAPGVAILTKWD